MVELAVADDVEAVADLAGANHDVSGRDVDLDEVRGDSLLGDERERGEERDALDERELRGGRDVRVDLDRAADA